MKYSFRYLKSFTLIELLIIIIIIGVLATSLIPRIKGIQDKARYTRVEKDFQDFKTAVFMAQNNTGKPLKDITGSYHMAGSCQNVYRSGGVAYGHTNSIDLRVISYGSTCRVARRQALRNIEQAAGLQTGALSGLETDPWGSPYLLDKNEGEVHVNYATTCTPDTLHTVGPNGIGEANYTIAISDARLTTGDNRGINIVPFRCPGGY